MEEQALMKTVTLAAASIAVIFLSACGKSAGSPPAAAPSVPAQASSSAAPAEPETAAGAKSAAVTYFDLYAARQYAAGYRLLTHAARTAVPKRTWVKVHDDCISSAGLAYKVSRPQLAGTTAVVNVSLAGAASKIGSEEQSFTYQGGRWLFAPSDLPTYRHHTVAQAVAALKAQGLCS
jgi:hypothetical protein